MPIEFSDSSDLLIKYVTFRGIISAEEFHAFSKQSLAGTRRQQTISYADMGSLLDCQFDFASVREHARRAQSRTLQTKRKFYEIIFAPSDLAFGLARMYQTLVGGVFDVKVFRTETDAKRTLEHARDSITLS